LAGTLEMTTNFRLLNPVNNEPDEFSVFQNGPEGVNQELRCELENNKCALASL
jgi:hypothetical protein